MPVEEERKMKKKKKRKEEGSDTGYTLVALISFFSRSLCLSAALSPRGRSWPSPVLTGAPGCVLQNEEEAQESRRETGGGGTRCPEQRCFASRVSARCGDGHRRADDPGWCVPTAAKRTAC
jgi:hypothetical protein